MIPMIRLLCLLLCVASGLRAAHAAALTKPSKEEDKAAPLEEVNVLMFGILQFSDSLNYAYGTTEAKMARISRVLRSCEGALQRLGGQIEQAAEVKKQMKEVIELLQAQMAKQRDQTKMTKDWLTSVEKEEVALQTKVKWLEAFLDNSLPTGIKELQERAEEHFNILKGLQDLTQFHKENIELQNEKLSELQRMAEAMT